MSKRQSHTNQQFEGIMLNPHRDIPCRDELKPFVRTAAIAAIKLARYDQGDSYGYWLTKEHVEALRFLPLVYSQNEASLVAEAVETFLRVQLGERYALRLAVGSFRTTEDDVRLAWNVLRREAAAL